MALAKGDSGCTAGLSKRIYDNLVADRARMAFTGSATTAETNFLKAVAWAVAQAMVDEVVANGEAFITTSKGALQQAAAVDTTAPTAERSLPLR
jgi:hypothetical protein